MRRIHIRGGMIHDGTGGAPFRGDVLVADDRIIAVEAGGIAGSIADAEIVEAAGLAVAPGFMDAHSHSEWIVPEKSHATILRPLMLQGITTFMGGNCGFSPFPVTDDDADTVLDNSRFLTNGRFAFHWRSQQEYYDYLKKNGIALNTASLIGHGPLRTMLKGNAPVALTSAGRERLAAMLAEAFDDGAYGVSIGLSYVPGIFADESEIEAVFAAAARADKIVTVHGRTYSRSSPFFDAPPQTSPHNLLDIASFVRIAGKTGAKLHISHLLLKGSQTWDLWPDALRLFENAQADGIDATFGVIPYHCGNTLITTLFPKWFLEDFAGNVQKAKQVKRLEREVFETEKAIGRDFSDLFLLWGVNPSLARHEGKSFSGIARELGMAEIEACLFLAKESGGTAKVLTAAYSGKEGVCPEPLEQLLAHPLALVEIDAILTSATGPQIPAAYGALPRWLGHYCRDRKLVPIEQGVRRVTGAVADRFGIAGRGYLQPGYAADMTLFNPAAIAADNSIAAPARPPLGISRTYINGKLAVKDGELCSPDLHGRVLYSK